MRELQQKLLLWELAKAGYLSAAYSPETDRIVVEPSNARSLEINGAGNMVYGGDVDTAELRSMQALTGKVREMLGAWEASREMPVAGLLQYRLLAEYNAVALAARDDTKAGQGLYFVTWQYNRDRTGVDLGHYTEDYAAAKEDFAVRSGLMPETARNERPARQGMCYPIHGGESDTAREASGDPSYDAEPRRYMGVDLNRCIGAIAEPVMVYHKNDWKIDLEMLSDKADSPDPEDKRLVWHVCSMGTHLQRERDVYVRDSGAYAYMTDYRQDDPDMFGYVMEITGREGGFRGSLRAYAGKLP